MTMTAEILKLESDPRQDDYDKKNAELELLVKKAVHGDSKALFSLCEKIAKGVLYRTKYMLGNDMDAEDVSQNVLLRVCENIQSLRNPKAFRAWLSGIVLNETRRYKTESVKRGNVVNIDDYLDGIFEKNVERLPKEATEEKLSNQDIKEIVSHLPARQREAVHLHFYENLKIADVARTMKIPHQCVSKYLTLALKKLRIEVENPPPESALISQSNKE